MDAVEGVALETERRVTYVDCSCLPLQIKLSYALIDFIYLIDYFSSQGFTLIRLLISLNFENNPVAQLVQELHLKSCIYKVDSLLPAKTLLSS